MSGILREEFDHKTGVGINLLVRMGAIGIFFNLATAQVFIGKLAAHKGPGLVSETDTLHPFESRQIEPLFIVTDLMGKGQQRCTPDISRRKNRR